MEWPKKNYLKRSKKELQKRYPNTELRGDGQVVVITFNNYEVELCPAFEESDGSFTYPDSNNGGKWKRTDSLVEMGESEYMIDHTSQHFKYVCQIVRAWKNHIGFKMGGLLIDTLVHKFFKKYPDYYNATFDDYLVLLKDLFYYLKGLNKDQKYWFALGSNQRVYNKGGKFVNKADDAYALLKDLDKDSEGVSEKLQEIFGKSFPIPESITKSEHMAYASFHVSDSEQFIHNLFPVDIKFNVRIDCEVKQNGFRETLLRVLLREKKPLLPNKNLTFFYIFK
ncbi:SMODS domain-containing nucleotidyltransferase [Cohnella rhizosphaerae]|uniref:Adenylyl/Guanylyl and SMODS C-terminal sensor domain-containing protein n=1 Tax=Cohnella rhizosphaerae TaxID=1457232 RepID=A0A9X4KU50_9BACL|nr:hypothetical protein [Cohnella rhizosphaerae]MDG0811114.1 hypothetical protein [Cohnella rhizosphaerae]